MQSHIESRRERESHRESQSEGQRASKRESQRERGFGFEKGPQRRTCRGGARSSTRLPASCPSTPPQLGKIPRTSNANSTSCRQHAPPLSRNHCLCLVGSLSPSLSLPLCLGVENGPRRRTCRGGARSGTRPPASCPRTGPPPRTTIGPWAQGFCRVLEAGKRGTPVL